jgi:hypothetical protein
VINVAPMFFQIIQLGIQSFTLVAEHHKPMTSWTTERMQILITTTIEVAEVKVKFFDCFLCLHNYVSTGAKKTKHLLPKYQSYRVVLLMAKLIKKPCKM